MGLVAVERGVRAGANRRLKVGKVLKWCEARGLVYVVAQPSAVGVGGAGVSRVGGGVESGKRFFFGRVCGTWFL